MASFIVGGVKSAWRLLASPYRASQEPVDLEPSLLQIRKRTNPWLGNVVLGDDDEGAAGVTPNTVPRARLAKRRRDGDEDDNDARRCLTASADHQVECSVVARDGGARFALLHRMVLSYDTNGNVATTGTAAQG